MEHILQVKIFGLMVELLNLCKMKKQIKILNKIYRQPISCVAIYSASIAKILDGNIDLVLIGDSLGTTLYGMKNTREVSLNMMKTHGRAVVKNINKSITVIDMPFKTYENKFQALKNAKELLNYTKAGIIKLEINRKKIKLIKILTDNNIDVIAHIGVTPQSYTNFSKIKVLGKTIQEQDNLLKLAKKAELYGAKAILLECVTENTAKKITSSLTIPTIGIGSSKFCDGQILVFDDLVNLNSSSHKPKFVKNFINLSKLIKSAIKKYERDVKLKKFPGKSNSYQ